MRVTIDQGCRTGQDGVIRLTESCEQVTGVPNSQEAPPTVDPDKASRTYGGASHRPDWF